MVKDNLLNLFKEKLTALVEIDKKRRTSMITATLNQQSSHGL